MKKHIVCKETCEKEILLVEREIINLLTKRIIEVYHCLDDCLLISSKTKLDMIEWLAWRIVAISIMSENADFEDLPDMRKMVQELEKQDLMDLYESFLVK